MNSSFFFSSNIAKTVIITRIHFHLFGKKKVAFFFNQVKLALYFTSVTISKPSVRHIVSDLYLSAYLFTKFLTM